MSPAAAEESTRRCACCFVPSGLYFGVDAGNTFRFDSPGLPFLLSPGAGFHAGYRAPSGIALDLRLDDLGAARVVGGYAGGAGLRYTMPRRYLRPFVDAHVGAESNGGRTGLATDLGFGVAVPLGVHAELTLSAREWMGLLESVTERAGMMFGFTFGWEQPRRQKRPSTTALPGPSRSAVALFEDGALR
jgi:hypothetical protein